MTTKERREGFYSFVSGLPAKSKGRYISGLENAYNQLLVRKPKMAKRYPTVYDIDSIPKLNDIKDEPEFHKRKTQGGTAEYRGINLYVEFLYMNEDSYLGFLKTFKIGEKDFFDWGIKNAIFPNAKEIRKGWDELIDRVTNGSNPVYIRGYGRDAKNTELYINMYKELFPLAIVVKDGTNNAKPKSNLEKMTNLKRNENIFNYQISHIFGNTKNLFLFEAPWNICYLPKLMDPLSGHEAKGILPQKFQTMFQKRLSLKYKKYIVEYHSLLIKYDVKNKMILHFTKLKSSSRYKSDKDYKNTVDQFERDAYTEFFELVNKSL